MPLNVSTARSALVAAAFVVVGASAQADTNLLANGSFETGSFAGWSTVLGDNTTFVDYGPTGTAVGDATDGIFLAFFGSTSASGGSFIAQAFATQPGAGYVLSFDLANDNGGVAAANGFVVQLNGTTVLSFSQQPDLDHSHYSVAYTASGMRSSLLLGGYNDSGYTELDAVSVSAAVAAVPEPTTGALTAAGLIALGAALRRRGDRKTSRRVVVDGVHRQPDHRLFVSRVALRD